MTEYRLVTLWHIQAPLHDVYDVIVESLHWPDWWSGVEKVEQHVPGTTDGIGSVRRYTWKSRLSYRICFDACANRIEPRCALQATVSGDLEGNGLWLFSHNEGMTTVRYEWRVRTTRRWMNLLAPVARSMFIKNHCALMENGAQGLARILGARLIKVSHGALPAESGAARHPPEAKPASQQCPTNWAAAIAAGIGAGIIATLVQLVLWWACSIPLPHILLRDAQLAAAIVMGGAVLPPPVSFEWHVMLVAAVVHFVLSIGYGLILAPLLTHFNVRRALFAGALFGLVLYGMNMYGFTTVFPWFEASRDWITAVAHASFGIAAAAIYTMWDDLRRLAGRNRGSSPGM